MAVTTVSTTVGLVIRFDGEVLEVFDYEGSRRIHVLQMSSVELGGGMLGGTMLSVGLKQGAYRVMVRLQPDEAQALEHLLASVRVAAGLA